MDVVDAPKKVSNLKSTVVLSSIIDCDHVRKEEISDKDGVDTSRGKIAGEVPCMVWLRHSY